MVTARDSQHREAKGLRQSECVRELDVRCSATRKFDEESGRPHEPDGNGTLSRSCGHDPEWRYRDTPRTGGGPSMGRCSVT